VVCSSLRGLLFGEFARSFSEEALNPGSILVLVLVREVLHDGLAGVHTLEARLEESSISRVEESFGREVLENLVS